MTGRPAATIPGGRARAGVAGCADRALAGWQGALLEPRGGVHLRYAPKEVIGRPWMKWSFPPPPRRGTHDVERDAQLGSVLFETERRGRTAPTWTSTSRCGSCPARTAGPLLVATRRTSRCSRALREERVSRRSFAGSWKRLRRDGHRRRRRRHHLDQPSDERLFGYGRDELLAGRSRCWVPDRFRSGHPSAAGVTSRPPDASHGRGDRAFGRRKDGSEFPAEISLSPMETGTRGWSRPRSATSRAQKVEAKFRNLLEAAARRGGDREPRGQDRPGQHAGEKLFGYPRKDLLDRTSRCWFRSDSAAGTPTTGPATSPIQGAIDGSGLELYGLRKTAPSSVEISLSPPGDRGGTLVSTAIRTSPSESARRTSSRGCSSPPRTPSSS